MLAKIDFTNIVAEYFAHGLFDESIKSVKTIVRKTNDDLRKAEKVKEESQPKYKDFTIYFGAYEIISTSENVHAQLEFNLKTAFNLFISPEKNKETCR